MLKVKLNPVAFEHEELNPSSLNNNLFFKHSLQVVEKLKDQLDLSVEALTRCYELDFPDEVTINVNFVSPNQKNELCSYFGFDDNKTLGFYAVTTGDGFLDEKYYLDRFEVFIFGPSNKEYFEIVEDNNNNSNLESMGSSLFSYLTTVTHEIKHALVFIESSGGLTPHQIDIVYTSGEFDNDIYDCLSGCNLERLEDYFYYNGCAYVDISHQDINEEIVEHEGREILSSLDIDFENMANELEKVYKISVENDLSKTYTKKMLR